MPTVEEKIAAAQNQLRGEGNQYVDKAKIQPYGAWERMTSSPTATATTSPFTGNVYYNPNVMKDRDQQLVNTDIAHELEHTRQIQSQGPIDLGIGILKTLFTNQGPYYTRPNELEARQAEADRNDRLGLQAEGDIYLPSMKGLRKAR
jgi:hypothetical protein